MTLLRLSVSPLRHLHIHLAVAAGTLFCVPDIAGAMPHSQIHNPEWVTDAIASRVGADLGRANRDVRDDRALFTWTGRVDREVLIVVSGRDVRTRGFDASLPNRTRVLSPLPRNSGDVFVRVDDGRGDVDVIEQPSARNGFQAVLRIRDPRGGADNYRITAFWDDRFGIDDRRGRNDRYDPRDDDRDIGGWGRNGRRDDNRNTDNRNNDNRGGRSNRDGQSGALNWSGRVDDVVEIHISGRRIDTFTRSGQQHSDVTTNIRGGGLPSRNIVLTIDQRSGRGSIALVQQPANWNGFTAIIRINDSRSGAAFYDFSAFWE